MLCGCNNVAELECDIIKCIFNEVYNVTGVCCSAVAVDWLCDNDSGREDKDTISNPSCNPTTKQPALVSVQQARQHEYSLIVICRRDYSNAVCDSDNLKSHMSYVYPEKLVRDDVVPLLRLSVSLPYPFMMWRWRNKLKRVPFKFFAPSPLLQVRS